MRIAFVSDIHEDYISLGKALAFIKDQGANSIVCLGDISGFSELHHGHKNHKSASRTLKLLKQADIIIKGNHDHFACKTFPKHDICFSFPDNWYSLSVKEQKEFSKNKLWLYEDDEQTDYSEKDILFLKSKKEYAVVTHQNYSLLFSHYIYPNLSGSSKNFITSTKELLTHFQWMQSLNASFSFCGHGHPALTTIYEFSQEKKLAFGNAVKLNKNSIIMLPAIVKNDNAQGFCIFDTESFILKAFSIS